MESPYLTFIIMYWPIFIAFLLFISIFLLRKDSIDGLDDDSGLRYGIAGFSLPIPIKGILVLRIIIFLSGCFLFSLPTFYNYSEYYPKSFDVDAYFDDPGIEQALKEFSDEDIEGISILINWKDDKRKYFENINSILLKILNLNNFFDITGVCIHSKGELTISVTKVKGFQDYYINESHGFLNHCVEFPNDKLRKINSEFNLLDARGNKYIKLNLYDIL